MSDVLFITDKSFESQARGLFEKGSRVPVEISTITAGKFRRYKHLSMLKQLTMPRIVIPNIVDMFKTIIGFFQSLGQIIRFKPDVVFVKGGFVCLPVGLAARLMGVPIVVHDSDARPGLTNRIVGRWAQAIATGSPLENYNYDQNISKYVGVPISSSFRPFSDDEQKQAKVQLGFDPNKLLLVVTGGGLGSTSINQAIASVAQSIIDMDVQIYHIVGRDNYQNFKQSLEVDDSRYQFVPFVYDQMNQVLGSADLVVSRASATFIQELAGLAKPVVLVPAKTLGDQLKNAEAYRQSNSALVLTDDEISQPAEFLAQLKQLLESKSDRERLAKSLHQYAKPNASQDVAVLLVESAKKR